MREEYKSQQKIRDMLAKFMVNNPMSWNEFARRSGVSINTIKKFRRGGDLGQVAPLFRILKFIREYKG